MHASRTLFFTKSRHFAFFKKGHRRPPPPLPKRRKWVTAQQTFVLMKTSWRRLSSSSSEDILKTSSRRLDQDEYARLSLTSSEDVFKTFSKFAREIKISHILVFQFTTPLVAAFRCVFRTWSNIYNGSFLRKYLKALKVH